VFLEANLGDNINSGLLDFCKEKEIVQGERGTLKRKRKRKKNKEI
jgi:hypothetical protein